MTHYKFYGTIEEEFWHFKKGRLGDSSFSFVLRINQKKKKKSLICFNLLLLLVEDWQLVAVVEVVAVVVLSLFLLLLIVIVLWLLLVIRVGSAFEIHVKGEINSTVKLYITSLGLRDVTHTLAAGFVEECLLHQIILNGVVWYIFRREMYESF